MALIKIESMSEIDEYVKMESVKDLMDYLFDYGEYKLENMFEECVNVHNPAFATVCEECYEEGFKLWFSLASGDMFSDLMEYGNLSYLDLDFTMID